MTLVKTFLISLVLWPALAFATLEEAQWIEAGLRSMGAPPAQSIHVPLRHLASDSVLEPVNATIAGRVMWVRLQCRKRSQCGDLIATIHYDRPEEAQAAYQALAKSQKKAMRTSILLRAGRHLMLTLAGKRMTLRMNAVALESGGLGDRIHVRERDTRQIYSGVITSPGEVRGEL